MRSPARLLAGALVAAAAAAARADVIEMADGTRVEAKLLEIDASNVRYVRKGGSEETRPRADVAAVLFFRAAKAGERPAPAIRDRVEMDGFAADGTLLRFSREKLGPFGLTRVAMVDAAGRIVALVTPRRIASVAFGTWKTPAPVKPPKGAKPGKPPKPQIPPAPATAAEACAAAESALGAATTESDVPALLFAAHAALAVQSDEAAKNRLMACIDAAMSLLPEHEKRRVSIGEIRVGVVDFSEIVLPADIPGLPPAVGIPPLRRPPPEEGSDPEAAERGVGPGVYAFFDVETTTGELLGPTVRVYWRSKDGRAGFEEKAVFTKTRSRLHVMGIGMSWTGHEIERIAVQLRAGGRVIGTREAVIAGAKTWQGAPWWEGAVDPSWPARFVVHKDGGREKGNVTGTYWEQRPNSGAVDEDDADGD